LFSLRCVTDSILLLNQLHADIIIPHRKLHCELIRRDKSYLWYRKRKIKDKVSAVKLSELDFLYDKPMGRPESEDIFMFILLMVKYTRAVNP
jgi:hypothetical protein